MSVDVATPARGVGKRKGQATRAMRVARSLSPQDLRRVQLMKKNGIRIPLRALIAARKAKLPLAYACALLMKESDGGDNVYGHDRDGHGNIIFHGQKGRVAVTKQNYLEYKRKRGAKGKGGMQGVGPTQLTWYEFQDDADERGGCWDPAVNMLIGFELLAGHIRRFGLREGFRHYNGEGPAAEAYADDAVKRVKKWEAILKEKQPAPKKRVLNPRNWWKQYVFGDTDCDRDLLTRLANVSKELHQPIFVREGRRTHEEQRQRWLLFQSGRGPRAARPGTSRHETGNAADCAVGRDRNAPNIGDVPGARQALKRRGLCLAATGESWHVEVGNEWRG